MRSLPLVLCCLLFAVFARAAATDSVEIMFMQLGKPYVGFLLDGEIWKKELIDGQADFANFSQLSRSEYYVGYRLKANLTTVNEFTGESLLLTFLAADFNGFIELEGSKVTPMISAGAKNYMLSRFHRNRGWVSFQLPAPIAPSLSFQSFDTSISVGETGQAERLERVEMANEQRGGMLFVRWTGPVEDGADQKRLDDYYSPQVPIRREHNTIPIQWLRSLRMDRNGPVQSALEQ